jgi:hypothetical protein
MYNLDICIDLSLIAEQRHFVVIIDIKYEETPFYPFRQS